ncbi:MAG TPA: hypothetical protein VE135_21020 [Pyrinomonadaceae bacterium]|nr:hypothetical protein [Pyrinomonadaceae bacterium]
MKKEQSLVTLTSALAIIVAMASIAAANELSVDPANFVREVNNKFFPLRPGTTFFYEGEKDGIPSSNKTFVTHQTKRILGVKCTEVRDQAFENGILVEDTLDWYAQDIYGNVWYFGEDSKELDPAGNVISTEGSWEAGVDDAEPGIIMEANPQVGDRYHQEFARGVAEDMARVLSLEESTCVLYGCFDHLLLTRETTRLDPGVVEQKYYAENVGFILAVTVKGGDERSELVRITTS